MILLCFLQQQKEKKYDISLRETKSPIKAKKFTPLLLPTDEEQQHFCFLQQKMCTTIVAILNFFEAVVVGPSSWMLNPKKKFLPLGLKFSQVRFVRPLLSIDLLAPSKQKKNVLLFCYKTKDPPLQSFSVAQKTCMTKTRGKGQKLLFATHQK